VLPDHELDHYLAIEINGWLHGNGAYWSKPTKAFIYSYGQWTPTTDLNQLQLSLEAFDTDDTNLTDYHHALQWLTYSPTNSSWYTTLMSTARQRAECIWVAKECVGWDEPIEDDEPEDE